MRKQNKPTLVQVIYPLSQCGMNFLAELSHAHDIISQIKTLDYAFNHNGRYYPIPDEKQDFNCGNPDHKSQIFFTDTVNNDLSDNNRWAEIKKLCTRGPVTPNARYAENSTFRNNIAVYVLVRKDYYKWRDEYVKSNNLKLDNDVKKEEVVKVHPEPVPTPEVEDVAAPTQPQVINTEGRMFNFL